MVKFDEGPGQLLAVGTTLIVAVTGTLVRFIGANAGMLPVPLAARPIDVVLFVQANVVPLTALEKFTLAVVVALQTV